jgi:hypothetical protein
MILHSPGQSYSVDVNLFVMKRGIFDMTYGLMNCIVDEDSKPSQSPRLFRRVTLTGIPSAGFAVAFSC